MIFLNRSSTLIDWSSQDLARSFEPGGTGSAEPHTRLTPSYKVRDRPQLDCHFFVLARSVSLFSISRASSRSPRRIRSRFDRRLRQGLLSIFRSFCCRSARFCVFLVYLGVWRFRCSDPITLTVSEWIWRSVLFECHFSAWSFQILAFRFRSVNPKWSDRFCPSKDFGYLFLCSIMG